MVNQKTVSTDFPQGKVYQFLKIIKSKNKPKDVSTEIKMDMDLKKLKFCLPPDYYNNVVDVTTRCNMVKSETNLIKLMLKKVPSEMNVDKILVHLSNTTK